MALNARSMAALAAEAARDKKAHHVVVMEMAGITPITDYFVICSGTNPIQVRAIADHIEEKMQEANVQKLHAEGYGTGRWILLDYGHVVVHVFHERERDYYNLERLWGDAQIVETEPAQVVET